MLDPHQRATLISNPAGVMWHHFLGSRFLGESLGIVIQAIQQETHEHAELRGLVEQSQGGALPIVADFTGALNIETREITIHQTQPERDYSGQFSENGRVLRLRRHDQSKPSYLVHEDTLLDLT